MEDEETGLKAGIEIHQQLNTKKNSSAGARPGSGSPRTIPGNSSVTCVQPRARWVRLTTQPAKR